MNKREPTFGKSRDDTANNSAIVDFFHEMEDRINGILMDVQNQAYEAGWDDCERIRNQMKKDPEAKP
jgi:hypothetical protein